jgi:ubiquinone/menaquinone biosynthesis C-methylase UbiE
MSSADVKAFFDRVSSQWDTMRSSFYNSGVIDALAARARIDKAMTVADVGTGTGFVAAGLGPLAARVIGIDNSAPMLAVAAGNFDALGIDNALVVQGDLDRLPLPDDSVDAAVANMVLHHAPDPAAMVAEMTRVTRPGGWVAITDADSHNHEWMRTEQADLWLGFSPGDTASFFADARLLEHGHASLGMQ